MRAPALVVGERGSHLPACLQSEDVDVTAVVHAEGESQDAFLRRVAQRTATVVGRGLRLVALACNSESGRESTWRRGALAHALLAAVVGVEGGHLVISASDQVPPGVKQELFGVTSTLSESLAGSSVSVSVMFEPPPQVAERGRAA
jgi:hypothetical protein